MSDDHHEETFEATGSGAAQTFPKQCSAIRKNEHVMIKNRPCKVVEMSTSKTGKHGHAKVHMVAIDIFTGKKLEDICPSTHNMDIPIVNRKDYQLCDISEGYLNLMDTDTMDIIEHLKLPENEIGQAIQKQFEDGSDILVTVVTAVGEEMVMAWKNIPGK